MTEITPAVAVLLVIAVCLAITFVVVAAQAAWDSFMASSYVQSKRHMTDVTSENERDNASPGDPS
jgi:hypothetical protein